jgi:ATP-dependent helicase/DNAse subunit B
MKCENIRRSHLELFDRCQLAYKFTVHDRRVPDIKVPKWAVLGWVMHKAIEEAVTSDGNLSRTFGSCLKKTISIVEEEWSSTYPDIELKNSEIPRLSMESMCRAQLMVNNASRKLMPLIMKFKDREVEVPYNIALDQGGTITMKGRIDLVLKDGDDWKIIDYKTTKSSWEHKEVPVQLLYYAIGLAIKKNAKISSVETILANLESGNIPCRRWTSKEANLLIENSVNKIEHIRAMPPEKAVGNVTSYCKTLCQYNVSCPIFRSSNFK